MTRLKLILLGSFLGLTVTATAEENLDLETLVQGAVGFYNASPHTETRLPLLTSDQREDLLNGEVIKIRRPAPLEEGEEHRRERVVGYYLVHAPLARVWIAALDPHLIDIGELTEVRVANDGKGNSVWYQYAHLPWPVADRHWMLDLRKNIDLCQAAGGRVWQQGWKLHEDGERKANALVQNGGAEDLTPKNLEKAVYLPRNEGAWILFGLRDDVTLIGYHVVASMGGRIPESWIASYALARLDELLKGVAIKCDAIVGHYDAEHEPIIGGDGLPVPPLTN